MKETYIAKDIIDIDQQITYLPTLTIGIPVLNEEEHIERVISGFLNSKYQNLVEILIADGRSTDRTREIVEQISKEDPRVKLVDNPEKFQSFGLNRMIEQAEGELFLRADGHCYYKEDYVEKCVEVMLKTGARNVGGAQRYMAESSVQAGIALAVKSFLGNGGAKYMDDTYEGYADTVFLGCFWIKDLHEIGGFNTENVTNQDSELNLRMIEKYGKSVYVSPEIKSWYYPRDTFWKLFKQYFRYGRGRFLTRVLHPKSSPFRGMVPFISLMILTLYIMLDVFTQRSMYSFQIVSTLVIVLIVESIRVVVSKRNCFEHEIWNSKLKRPSTIVIIPTLMIALILMQVGHFFGFLFQLLKNGFSLRRSW